MPEWKRAHPKTELSKAVGRALEHAAKVARKTPMMHGTPVAIMKDGKIVLEKP